jgi:hypothetical protein
MNAIAEKNVTNYTRCLADTGNSSRTFGYLADPTIANANPGLFEKWGKEEEQNYLNQLNFFLPEDSTSRVSLDLLREDTRQDSVFFLYEYELTVRHKVEAEECPRLMKGQAELRIERTAEELWYIYRWSDNSTGSDPTWSALRAYFGK